MEGLLLHVGEWARLGCEDRNQCMAYLAKRKVEGYSRVRTSRFSTARSLTACVSSSLDSEPTPKRARQ
jgi:hypothetical protein